MVSRVRRHPFRQTTGCRCGAVGGRLPTDDAGEAGEGRSSPTGRDREAMSVVGNSGKLCLPWGAF